MEWGSPWYGVGEPLAWSGGALGMEWWSPWHGAGEPLPVEWVTKHASDGAHRHQKDAIVQRVAQIHHHSGSSQVTGETATD